ncbi:CU044_2847 family protein [Streptomyces phaeofaciens JCM 4814]|uniref:Trypsin-co-occurring domain-containing protein n=1 Tax=Streptomyces phaeofaciens TaxID=68254 RepID=A0A918LZV2_9ACTN|nr:CU044_2847 family protein [Streptomyces phaeofaciens]GGT80206.1 hypothetical protein GCM10010226_68460 [Streptomyces phaeofaciens]
MVSVGHIPLEGGGRILFEAESLPEAAGPVKAGRVADAVRELPGTLQDSLAPVRELAQAVVAQLREAGPAEVEVEFGVSLSAQAGAVISKGEAAAHLKVRVLWQRGTDSGDAA